MRFTKAKDKFGRMRYYVDSTYEVPEHWYIRLKSFWWLYWIVAIETIYLTWLTVNNFI
jgi:hypothetical protein